MSNNRKYEEYFKNFYIVYKYMVMLWGTNQESYFSYLSSQIELCSYKQLRTKPWGVAQLVRPWVCSPMVTSLLAQASTVIKKKKKKEQLRTVFMKGSKKLLFENSFLKMFPNRWLYAEFLHQQSLVFVWNWVLLMINPVGTMFK